MPRPDFNQLFSDLELRYSGTFVQYRPNPETPFETVYINGIVSEDDDYPKFNISGLKGNQLLSYKGTGEFNFSLPETRYFTYRGNSYVSFYRPSRQNKRSLCTGTSLRQNFYSQNRLTTHLGLDIYVADSIFNPQYMDYLTALDTLNKSAKYCIAIDGSYAIGLNPTVKKTHLLFHFFTPIAEVTTEGKIETVFHKSLESLVNAAPLTRF